MLKILKKRMTDLACDESGVAFAFTVTVSLIIFLFGFAIYACGETVRQRIELQNAADAASYSAALVQADTISRVAAINKAMSWSYVMMTRQQMDFIVDSWLGRVLERWYADRNTTWIYQTMCACHPWTEGVNWRVGVGAVHRQVRLNGHQQTDISMIEAARSQAAAGNLAGTLSSLRNCIAAMNYAEEHLVSMLNRRMKQAAEFAIKENISLTGNDKVVKDGRKINWTFHNLKDAHVYFEKLADEKRFLSFGGFTGSPTEIFGVGADTWLQGTAAGGFQRNYVQTGSTLHAYWERYNENWYHTLFGCVFSGVVHLACDPVTGEMAWNGMFTGQTASPYVLRPNYFRPDGAIVVGVSRPLNNPFAFIFNGGKQSGIYSAFNVGGGTQSMWGISAARAGYRLPGWKSGEYRNRGSLAANYNLCLADWDAMFLPLRDNNTADASMLGKLRQSLGVSSSFAGKDYKSPYTTIDFYGAREHLRH